MWSARKRSLQVRQSIERIGEPGQVPARLPRPRVLDDRRVERDHVVALLEHRPPPLVLDVVLEQHAVVAVVVARPEAAVDLAAREHEAAPLAQRHDLVHRHGVVAVTAAQRNRRARRRMVSGDAPAVGTLPLRVPKRAPILSEAMPIYEYRCEQGHTFEVMQRMSDDPVEICETCEAPVSRVFHPIAVHFKGSGFYNTDYGTRKRARENNSEKGEKSEKSERRTRATARPARARARRTPGRRPARRTRIRSPDPRRAPRAGPPPSPPTDARQRLLKKAPHEGQIQHAPGELPVYELRYVLLDGLRRDRQRVADAGDVLPTARVEDLHRRRARRARTQRTC